MTEISIKISRIPFEFHFPFTGIGIQANGMRMEFE
jgi:hypothetical protein